MYAVKLTAEARRAYERSERALQAKFDRCFDVLRQTPHRHPNIKPLKGRFAGRLRFRVGDHRVVYFVEDAAKEVAVVTIAHRRDVYE